MRMPMRPSWGLRFSAMSILAMIFKRETSGACRCSGCSADVAQHAVDAVAHAQAAVAGLDVDVARAHLQRIGEDARHEADDGRVVALLPLGAHPGRHLLLAASAVVLGEHAREHAGRSQRAGDLGPEHERELVGERCA